MYIRTEESPFHAAPLFPVLRDRQPTSYDLYHEKSAYEGALLQIETPRIFGYVAIGTLEAGNVPSKRLMAQYRDGDVSVEVHFTETHAWWVSNGEEDWEAESGDGIPETFPEELRKLLN